VSTIKDSMVVVLVYTNGILEFSLLHGKEFTHEFAYC